MIWLGRMLWCWKLNNPCTGSATANLPASLSQEEARRGVQRERGVSRAQNVMHIPREAVRMAPSRSWLRAACGIGPQSLVLGAGCGCRQSGHPSAAASVTANESQSTRGACAATETK